MPDFTKIAAPASVANYTWSNWHSPGRGTNGSSDGFFNSIGNAFGTIVDGIGSLIGGVVDVVESVVSGIASVVTGIFSGIKKRLTEVNFYTESLSNLRV